MIRSDGTGFWALLGPDLAGKSTVLRRLHDEHGWRVISYDERYLGPYPLIRQLRSSWITDAFGWAGKRYSPELVVSVLNPIVLYFREELARAAGADRVVIDSYYYKLLVKCRLLGVEHTPTFDYWRSFPQPGRVLYLDVPAETAWARSGDGTRVNRFEHYGPTVGRADFVRLQTDLRAALLAEVRDLPVRIVDGAAPPDEVVAAVLTTMREPAVAMAGSRAVGR
ncbi:dTMP kinase [Micromonospora schwarzwaldensis]|uniref:dTMP kinase n=1 Tax=Micromonospora sp. DSM 45708 TaxID=3111767 RepID=UPI0031DDD404